MILLRLHIGIITHGGDKVNVIPEKASLEYLLRAPNVKELDALKSKVVACANAAATSTGCEVSFPFDSSNSHLISMSTETSWFSHIQCFQSISSRHIQIEIKRMYRFDNILCKTNLILIYIITHVCDIFHAEKVRQCTFVVYTT